MIDEVPYSDILRIRKEAMYPDKDLDFVKLENDKLGIHMGFYVNGEIASIVSLFLENNKLQFRKLATLPKFQNKGYGSMLLKWVISYAKDMKFGSVWCNARKEKSSFYKRFDLSETNLIFEKNGYKYIVMEKNI